MATLGNTTVNSTLTVLGNMTGAGGISVGGTDVKTKLNLIDTLNTRLTRIVSQTFTPTVTYANGAWTISGASAYLVGNGLRVYFAATRSSKVSGNISNEHIGTLTINTGGRVKHASAVAFTSGTSGDVASMLVANTTTNASTGVVTVPINLNALGSDGSTSINAYFLMPCVLNTSAY